MQLTVREASKFLDVSESTVTRWIKQRGLPAQHVGGQYRFNRAEVLEWAAANQIKVSLELFDHFETDDEPVPTLAEALQAGGIFYGLKGTGKESALRSLVEVLPLPAGTDRELLFRLFLAREASAPTAIGGGIALPHTRNPVILHVDRPMVTLCFLEQPVEFGAMDGKPVQAFFSLVCPTMRSHLQMLSRISFALHDPPFKEAVMRQSSPEEILREACRVEESLPAPSPAAGKASD
ncbi:MAG: PTS sugar transporter subunit IIA [Deltaproteobacteria bacterium]